MNWNLPHKLVLVPVLILLTTLGWGCGNEGEGGKPQAGGLTLEVKETSLGKVHEEAFLSTLTVSPDSRRVAYIAVRGEGGAVVVDGQEGKKYDIVGVLSFSPNSNRFAYGARCGN